MLALEIFTKNSHKECYEKSFNGLVADDRLLVDGRAWSAYRLLVDGRAWSAYKALLFYFVGNT
jgi:hypothetical protein